MRAFLLERGRRQLYLCREGSTWVGFLLRRLVEESILVSESKENGLPIHVFYACKIILLFVVVKSVR